MTNPSSAPDCGENWPGLLGVAPQRSVAGPLSNNAAACLGARGQAATLYDTDLFRTQCYKVLPCSKRYAHDWMRCPFRHPGEKAARRPLTECCWYSATMCPDLDGMTCPRGDACGFSHNVFEHWLHPDRYRTQLCRDGSACHRRVCFFAHSIQELRTPSGRVIPAAENAEATIWTGPASPTDALASLDPPAGGAPRGPTSAPPSHLVMPCDEFDPVTYIPFPRRTNSASGSPDLTGRNVEADQCGGGVGIGQGINTVRSSLSSPDHSGPFRTVTAGSAGFLYAVAAPAPTLVAPGNAFTATAAAASAMAGPAAASWLPPASAGLAAPSLNEAFQALMQDAADRRSEAAAAVEAAARAQAAADDAAALISRLMFVAPQPSISSDGGAANTAIASRQSYRAGIADTCDAVATVEMMAADCVGAPVLQAAASPHLVGGLLGPRPMSTSGIPGTCMTLQGHALSPSQCHGDGAASSALGGSSGVSGPLLMRFLSGSHLLLGPYTAMDATPTTRPSLLSAPPLLDTPPAPPQLQHHGLVTTVAPSAQQQVLVNLQEGAAVGAPIMWFDGSL